ncbi:unnamed protein product [Meloidogyne enterolobii]|uniref:Uncharacterized protein n=1 Tax=Meloidogyne enterolobii TaxID=390850 RepID=A0ACB1A1J4_MELEN
MILNIKKDCECVEKVDFEKNIFLVNLYKILYFFIFIINLLLFLPYHLSPSFTSSPSPFSFFFFLPY